VEERQSLALGQGTLINFYRVKQSAKKREERELKVHQPALKAYGEHVRGGSRMSSKDKKDLTGEKNWAHTVSEEGSFLEGGGAWWVTRKNDLL